MAISQFDNKQELTQSDVEGFLLVLNNGDKAALDKIIERWDFKDATSFLRFVMAVMLKAENNKLFFEVQGIQTGATPSDDLLTPKNI